MTKRLLAAIFFAIWASGSGAVLADSQSRPNILLLVAEDMSSRVGAFGDTVAITPNLDSLSRQGTRFTNAFTTSGVCAPSRAALILGMHQTSVGAQHMRTSSYRRSAYRTVPPPQVKAFPELLRREGYYTYVTNKLDYQFSGVAANTGPASIWNAEGDRASWRGRSTDQPFFGMYQFYQTHESRGFADQPDRADASGLESPIRPKDVEVPEYYPDTATVRTAIAQHYNNIQVMDNQVGTILRQLEADGLADSTIVIWTTDHGDGLPRSKRELYDSGIHVPMIVRWPKKYRPARFPADGNDRQLISFIDLAPTILSWADVQIPQYIQGMPLADTVADTERRYIFAAKDRLDEFENHERAVRDQRYKYIRNSNPSTPGAQHLAYRDRLEIMQELWRLFEDGRLNKQQSFWFSPRPQEELYDTISDPDEVYNLAGDPAHGETLIRMRKALASWQESTEKYAGITEAELSDLFWPSGKQPITRPPTMSVSDRSRLLLHSNTQGASILYHLGEGSWQLYVKPLDVKDGALITAKAVRYGWAESTETQHRHVAISVDSPAVNRPNIVLMLSDDANWFDIGPYDRLYDYTPHNAITPNLDRMAEQGMLFTSAFTSTALCSPSRQQLYTGLFPVRNGAYPQHSRAYKSTRSAAHYFQEMGYRVGLAGKQHIAPNSVYPFEVVGKQNKGAGGATTFGLAGVERFVKRNRQQPFFLIIASSNPHGPWTRGNPYLYDEKKLNIPPFLVDTPEFRKNLVRYYAEISDLDNEVGLVDKVLEAAGVSENTLFIFTSEHGAGMPFAKFTTYDAGLKTAFIVRWPGRTDSGSTSDAMIQYVDVLPTLIEAVGGDVPNNIDGESFLEILSGETAHHRDYVYGIHTTRNIHKGSNYPIRSIRSKQHKLILNLMAKNTFSNLTTHSFDQRKGVLWDWKIKGDAGDQWATDRVRFYRQRPAVELYDILEDPFELNNLASEGNLQPAMDKVVNSLSLKLNAWMKQQGDLGVQTELAACKRTASFKTCP